MLPDEGLFRHILWSTLHLGSLNFDGCLKCSKQMEFKGGIRYAHVCLAVVCHACVQDLPPAGHRRRGVNENGEFGNHCIPV